ncbi:MAG: hypothetical protein M1819_006777 [Sarea resinae]|nr:MAG: hypothetical protein M1819_006777 [Sarea resinae]
MSGDISSSLNPFRQTKSADKVVRNVSLSPEERFPAIDSVEFEQRSISGLARGTSPTPIIAGGQQSIHGAASTTPNSQWAGYADSLPTAGTALDRSPGRESTSQRGRGLNGTLEQSGNVIRNPVKNVSMSAVASESNLGTPANPFENTLATLEQPRRGSSSAKEKRMSAQVTSAGRPKQGPQRASLDVDAFKRLLLTGKPVQPVHGTPATPPTQINSQLGILGDNSSGTDTSSISRQSIFEPIAEAQADTPRTSHEISPSDDEQQRLLGEASADKGRKKPPIPKLRHGKPIKGNIPQIVSFTDPAFDPPSFEQSLSSNSRHTSSTGSRRSRSDLNKPLPPPPLSTSSTLASEEGLAGDADEEGARLSSPTSARRKRAPTPPLARRHSQLRNSKPPLSRSNSARLSPRPEEVASETSSDTTIGRPASMNKPPPPPPPSRRPGVDQSRSLSSVPTVSIMAVSSHTTSRTLDSYSGLSKAPAPPPARTVSGSSTKRSTRASSVSSSSSMTVPPPVPPPRKRGSSKGSIDSPSMLSSEARRFSGESRRSSHDQSRRGSTFLQPGEQDTPFSESPPTEESEEKDVLADLSALQREVDALRGRFETRRPS